MKSNLGGPEKVKLRHISGFRRFQRAALKALSAAHLKVGDMKSLVSAYKEAVAGERMVLGLEGAGSTDWPEEMVVRWVEDEEHNPEGSGLDIS